MTKVYSAQEAKEITKNNIVKLALENEFVLGFIDAIEEQAILGEYYTSAEYYPENKEEPSPKKRDIQLIKKYFQLLEYTVTIMDTSPESFSIQIHWQHGYGYD